MAIVATVPRQRGLKGPFKFNHHYNESSSKDRFALTTFSPPEFLHADPSTRSLLTPFPHLKSVALSNLDHVRPWHNFDISTQSRLSVREVAKLSRGRLSRSEGEAERAGAQFPEKSHRKTGIAASEAAVTD